MSRFLVLSVTTVCALLPAFAQVRVAPGGPRRSMRIGQAQQRTDSALQPHCNQKCGFTLSNGVLSEVYYPTLDKPNTQSLRFIYLYGSSL
jgi:hypothetical protein